MDYLNQEESECPLNKLAALGAVEHHRFVFSQVPYPAEASRRIWHAANSNFPDVVNLTAPFYNANAPGYGKNPCVLKVWDVPGEMARWSTFFEAQNHR